MNSNRVALVTGGSRGIGKAITLSLAESGFDLAINYAHRKETAQEAQTAVSKLGVRAEIIQADIGQLTEHHHLEEFLKRNFGRLDVLVNNAGVAPAKRSDLLEAEESSFDHLIMTNLKGPFFLTQRMANWMITMRSQIREYRPSIINISSISSYTASTNRAEYCLSKAALSMMTQLFASRLAEYDIPVFEIRPGVIQTDMTASVRDSYDRLIAGGLTPIKRWGMPEDVAKAVAAIVKGYFPFSTGQVIDVDGGFHLRRL
ncbi:MAG: 3-ketoacyl-ACP reductase [Terriglobia bacterium]